ncbi:hypothetical protein BBOMB_0049 [Bifidobacterium bombi DSM 19703]|uniref:Uncharacterized protein n=1 Tax=Bifidobacterium bombi DSM 19703 TaxID=1341695 RepID=A0A086BP79_9BIFI|nr:hypothetical protein BBOMB_0049 [Bifidobacterium bombi DSM 19703]
MYLPETRKESALKSGHDYSKCVTISHYLKTKCRLGQSASIDDVRGDARLTATKANPSP